MYLAVFFFEYGTSTAEDNSSKVKAQMRIPGISATGIRPRLPSSITTTPSHPGSKIEAVECTTIPNLQSDERPSNRANKSSGKVNDSIVVASTKSPGCKINGWLAGITTSSIMSEASFLSRGSMYGYRLCLKMRKEFPRRKSTEQLPSCDFRSKAGLNTTRLALSACLISRSERTI